MAFVLRKGARVYMYIDDFTGCSNQESFVHGILFSILGLKFCPIKKLVSWLGLQKTNLSPFHCLRVMRAQIIVNQQQSMPLGLILVFVNNLIPLLSNILLITRVLWQFQARVQTPKLQKLVREIFLSLCLYKIVMVPVWLSREHEVIQYADRWSRDFRYDDFSLTQDCLGNIKHIPTLTVDSFASAPNTVCLVFFSCFDSVGTSGVDFFNQYLSPSEFYYLCPPILKAVNVVKHMYYHRAKGVLVYPIWPTHISFNFLWPDGCHFANQPSKHFFPLFMLGVWQFLHASVVRSHFWHLLQKQTLFSLLI